MGKYDSAFTAQKYMLYILKALGAYSFCMGYLSNVYLGTFPGSVQEGYSWHSDVICVCLYFFPAFSLEIISQCTNIAKYSTLSFLENVK